VPATAPFGLVMVPPNAPVLSDWAHRKLTNTIIKRPPSAALRKCRLPLTPFEDRLLYSAK